MPLNLLTKFELKLGYLMPIFFILGVLINLWIASSPGLTLQAFAQVPLRAASFADYSRDPADLIFPPIDPDIIEDANNDGFDRGEPPVDAIETPTATSISPTAMPLPTLPLPTLPLPTQSIPTLPLPTLPLPTLPLPTLPLPNCIPLLNC